MKRAQGQGQRMNDAQRLAIIQELSAPSPRTVAAIAGSVGVSPRAVTKLWKNRDKVLTRCAGKTQAQLLTSFRYMPPKHPTVEVLLKEWLERIRNINFVVPPMLALAKADAIAREQGIAATTFSATYAWLSRFRRRHDVGRALLYGEEGDVDKADPALLLALDALAAVVTRYDPEAVLNMEETGIYYRVLPRVTLLAPGEDAKKVRGRKIPKERVTAIVCCNSTGSVKVPIALIGKVGKPVCAQKSPWPVPYYQQAKAWLDGVVFHKWLKDVLEPAVADLPFSRVLLVVNNAPGHLKEVSVGRIDVRFLPANCTSWRQPCDLGIIAAYKKGTNTF